MFETQFNAGDRVGPYELVAPLGAGAFGEVWRVRHAYLPAEERAMKIPTDQDCIRQLKTEGRLQFVLEHPHIVRTVDLSLDTSHGPAWFVMELVEGGSLRDRLRAEGKLSADAALRVVAQTLDALDAAHAQGVFHRDLKPENILLTADGDAKVTDFGLGKVQADIAQAVLLSGSLQTSAGKSVSGTYAYMSPEQQAGDPPSTRDDIYALGIVACELLTGKRPSGSGVAKVMTRAGIAGPIVEVVDKACDEAEYRYGSAAEMLADVRALAAGGRPAPPLPARPKAPQPMARPATPELITTAIGMKLKLIQPGTFRMGCESSRADDDEEPVHEVTLSKPFYLGVYPVTQAEYERVIGSNPSRFKGPNRPVEKVSWNDAQKFCRKLSENEGVEYRLPTEAQWEYACRAGSTTEFSFGDEEAQLGDYAWSDENSGGETHDVGQKKPNAWGLYDMHGNVWEWCQDWFGDYPGGAQTDPTGPAGGQLRVLRGGSWGANPRYCRSSYRVRALPVHPLYYWGARLARTQ